MTITRKESDSLGEVEVPADALYGAQTQRAVDNFPVGGGALPLAFIKTLVLVKSVAAAVNADLGTIEKEKAASIRTACEALLQRADLLEHFPVDVFQTGSGTSSNMNANEVIANLATRSLGRPVHPNDDVNCGQSSNDVIPTTIHVSAAIAIHERLLPVLTQLAAVIDKKSVSVEHFCKTGRTHLMDAMPVTMGQVLGGWASQIRQNIENIQAIQRPLQRLAQGGTAVGTGVNTHPEFAVRFARGLSRETGLKFEPGADFFALMGSQDTAVALSGLLKATAVSIVKIANDLRWMNSGPLAGLGEITLESLQPGSSIMPGKVNPVVPESAAMVAAQVIGNDAAITIGGQSGNFELNVMLPMIARNLLESIDLLASVSALLGERAIATFAVNEDVIARALGRNPILVTALNPIIGYQRAAEIAKKAYGSGRPILDVAEEMTELTRQELEKLLDPHNLTNPHNSGKA